jgi:pimeloyl-ACP methyl ester carboxylesterase
MDTFVQKIQTKLQSVETALRSNVEYKASSKDVTVTFGLRVGDGPAFLVVKIINGDTGIQASARSDASFDISARSEQWNNFFQPTPRAPFQSYWGMLRTIGPENGVQVIGDRAMFAKNSRIWRLALDQIRHTINGTEPIWDMSPEVEPEDFIRGRYIHTMTRLYGHARVFVESAGTGPQPILFLHTAGSDSRQSHVIMNTASLQERYKMYSFDLPGHGRSDLGTNQIIGELSLDEDTYIHVIQQVISKLGLQQVIVCGASMAGQICLAISLRAKEMGVAGVIACEACAHIPQNPRIYGYRGGDESILNPETVCGMMAPMSPEHHKKQVWWGYSSQGKGVFTGDLRFYFLGWDGRGRLSNIECPLYMLTGEYDYSCTPDMSRQTFEEIKAGNKANMVQFEVMSGLGHFPISEHVEKFLPYFEKAVRFIKAKAS